ncbi:unnamed protein product [Oppiella nova]|uniref:Uncharacterized protein n=1 Tax=Oppiella nova TaxID=334625 RepID=A0A7R9MBR0_9ACAR|nr:unnamed protein product [Oppiella nova]CAG2173364.1 unnamed protein product [Oppiella nova]
MINKITILCINQDIITIAVLCTTIKQVYSKCPVAATIKPCSCYDSGDSRSLSCYSANITDVKGLFQNISKALDEKDRQFDSLSLSLQSVAELPAQAFADIKFKKVSISGSKVLKHIDGDLLKGNSDSVIEFSASSLNLTDNLDIYNLVNSLEHLETLTLSRNNLNIIPENAFKEHKNLTTLKITSEQHLKISGNAFKSLGSSLRYMEIASANITAISDNAFAFDDTLKENLRLILNTDTIDLSGISKSAFAGAKRPISLVLIKDKTILYLDEAVFSTFMKGNPLNEVMTQIDCTECKNVWLKKPEFATQVNGIFCTNGLELNDPKNFVGC